MRLDAPGPTLLSLWDRLSTLPGGRWLFRRMLGFLVPYTGALGAEVEHLSPGRAEVSLRERRGVRNHLGSIHAVALANLGELASGLSVLTALPAGVRGIVVELRTRYHRKARGQVFASAHFTPPDLEGETDTEVSVDIRDGEGHRVATVTATWNLRPPEASA